jgi:hypothetical protein
MTIQHFVKTFFMKHFDDDGSEHVLKPSPLDKEAVSGAVTPNSRQNVQGEMMKRQHVQILMVLISFPQIPRACIPYSFR